ncbi:hypothetical protein A3K64_01980 [Candidatus Micrarchaeota archaeon RBG_16_36_9]|nr:MAG: hypothetical protein A3K64_01980 [Candidatus Micrarchaeota archaeon RBG_16_36_9]
MESYTIKKSGKIDKTSLDNKNSVKMDRNYGENIAPRPVRNEMLGIIEMEEIYGSAIRGLPETVDEPE